MKSVITDMKFRIVYIIVAVIALLFGIMVNVQAKSEDRSIDFNSSWKFIQSDVGSAERKDYNDSSWKTLDLPHDWSIALDFNASSKAGQTAGFLNGGTGKTETAKTLGMNGNLGDMTLTRTSDGTKVLQVYDDATSTTLKRDDVGFLYTSGNNTYMLGDWYYNGKPLPTYEQYAELEKRIAELESKI